MPQVPRELTPVASIHAFFGAELRHWRQRGRLSQRELGLRTNISGDLIGKIEKALRWPSESLATSCDLVLDTGGILARLWPLVAREHQIAAVFAEQLARPLISWGAPSSRAPNLLPYDTFSEKL
jgi:hypothetical protein